MIVIGHRGAMGYEPENTLRSLDRAIRDGVDALEFDVHCLKDGEIILMHDTTVDRTTNGTGLVSDYTLKEIQALDAGKGEKVPTLAQALDVIDRRVPVVIELCGFTPHTQIVAEIMQTYVTKKGWKYSDFKVASFIHKELIIMKNCLPSVQLGANISAIPHDHAEFTKGLQLSFVATEDLYLRDKEFVDDVHKKGMEFYVYSFDNPEYLKRFVPFGIDGFYANFPNRFTKK